MKFKNLLTKIRSLQENAPEQTFGGGLYIGDAGAGRTSALTNKGTFNIKLPYSIDAINAMLGAFSSKDYIDPMGMLGVVKQKLNHFGMDFDHKGAQNPEPGITKFSLVQYGSPQLGVYGQNPYDDVSKTGFKQGDGIKEKLGHGLDMVVNVQKNPNGLHRMNIVIVPSEGNPEIAASEESDCGCMH
jgi:hypothetical protein